MAEPATETWVDKIIKFIKLISQIVWLAVGIVTLMASIYVYQLIKSGELMKQVQAAVTSSISGTIPKGGNITDAVNNLTPQQIEQLKLIK